jgi:cysteine-rich repeat protein
VAICGNGMQQGSEECDDGNTNDADGCRTNCMLPRCGDGVVQTGEECDDGNPSNDDGCLNTCLSSENPDSAAPDGSAEAGVDAEAGSPDAADAGDASAGDADAPACGELNQDCCAGSTPCGPGLVCSGSAIKTCTPDGDAATSDGAVAANDIVYCTCTGATAPAILCADIPTCSGGLPAPAGTCDSVCTAGTDTSACFPNNTLCGGP